MSVSNESTEEREQEAKCPTCGLGQHLVIQSDCYDTFHDRRPTARRAVDVTLHRIEDMQAELRTLQGENERLTKELEAAGKDAREWMEYDREQIETLRTALDDARRKLELIRAFFEEYGSGQRADDKLPDKEGFCIAFAQVIYDSRPLTERERQHGLELAAAARAALQSSPMNEEPKDA